MRITAFLTWIILAAGSAAMAQKPVFTRQDSLRGSVTPERAWWDLTYYHLDVSVDPESKRIKGSNTVQYQVLQEHNIMQLDLQEPMKIDRITQDGRDLKFNREGNVYWVQLPAKEKPGVTKNIIVQFSGKPKVAQNPPWDGGFTWQKDKNGNHFIANANQGDGASLWWPCKDHMYDETDSMKISLTVPETLTGVANGRLMSTERNKKAKTKTFHWFVSNPINNYGVNLNIADYVHFGEVYNGEKGKLDCDYYVLRYNLEKAKQQFKDATRTLEALEHWFGPYPFYEDSYKLVEVPYLGMEHQSSVTYGNNYQNGYRGRDLSGTGWGLKFDFIIVHETGHEWFANNITNRDNADLWIHESFTAYSENLFLNYHYGEEAAAAYVLGTRSSIQNDRPMIGFYDVNYRGSGDIYYKGANMLHTLRQIVNDDEKWRNILRGLNKDFYHQTVTSAQIENYLSEKTGYDLSSFFDQYLRDTRIPVLEYRLSDGQLYYRWGNTVNNFKMPVSLIINGKTQRLLAGTHWQVMEGVAGDAQVKVDPNFYVGSLNILGGYNQVKPE